MHCSLRTLAFASIASVLFIVTTEAHAAAQRTFVASYGLDANPCSLPAPCRGFQAAIDAVAPGGEVVALDSAGYGAMEIHKSVSVIVPTGTHAGLSPSTGIPLPGYPGQSGVVMIDIQDTDWVVLRGLSINHQGTVTGGIEWISAHGGTVQIENAVINGFPMEGLYVQAPHGKLIVKDSVLRNNGVSIFGGLSGGADGSSGGVVVEHVTIESSGTGIRMSSGTLVVLTDSVLTSNGVALDATATTNTTVVDIVRCTVASNAYSYYLHGSPSVAWLVTMGTLWTQNGPETRTGSTDIVSYGNNGGSIGPFNVSIPPL